MDNETGILKALLILLEDQLWLRNRLIELEARYQSLSETVLDGSPAEVRHSYEERRDDLTRAAKSNNDLVPYAVHRATEEIRELLKKKY